MKRILITTILLGYISLVFFARAQDSFADVSWTKSQNRCVEYVFDSASPLGYDSSGVVLLCDPITSSQPNEIILGPGQDYAFMRVGSDMSLNPMKIIDLKEGDSKKEFEFALWLNNEYYVFTSFQNQASKKTYLFSQSLNKQTLEVNDDLRKLAEIDYSEHNRYNSSLFNYSLSSDSSKILITCLLTDKSKAVLEMQMFVFSDSWDIIWKKGIVTSAFEKIFAYQNFTVNNNGEVFVLGKSYSSKRDFENDNINKKHILITISEDGKKTREYNLDIPDKLVRYLTMKPNDKGEVICAGFYAHDQMRSIIGACTFHLNLTNEKMELSHQSFPVEFLMEGRKKSEAKKIQSNHSRNKEFDDDEYTIEPLFLREDGGYFLAATQIKLRTIYASNGSTYTYQILTYNFNDVIIIAFDKSGTLQWHKKIDHSSKPMQIGMTKALLLKDNLYVLHNKLNTKELALLPSLKNAELRLSRITPDGQMQTQTIPSGEEINMAIMPYTARRAGEASIMVQGISAWYAVSFLRIDLN